MLKFSVMTPNWNHLPKEHSSEAGLNFFFFLNILNCPAGQVVLSDFYSSFKKSTCPCLLKE